jgi:NAD-dependent dihydropyrimidine dehydrogenase PreA subunit
LIKKIKVIILDEAGNLWFPIIFSDKCDGCVKTGRPRCLEYCPNGVYAFEEGKAVVANPTKCVKGCSSCVSLCHKKAISFPSRNISYVQVKDMDKGMFRKTTCTACSKQYWTNGENNVCFDCESK